MRVRRITLADMPVDTPSPHRRLMRREIFARNEQGDPYLDPVNSDLLAKTTAWFGFTTEPWPRRLRHNNRKGD